MSSITSYISTLKKQVSLLLSKYQQLSECNDDEKSNPNNYLVFVENIGQMFTSGLITFDEEKKLLLSNSVPQNYKNSTLQ